MLFFSNYWKKMYFSFTIINIIIIYSIITFIIIIY